MATKIPKFLIKSYIKIKEPSKRKDFVDKYQFINFVAKNFGIMDIESKFHNFQDESGNIIDRDDITKVILKLLSEQNQNVEKYCIPKNVIDSIKSNSIYRRTTNNFERDILYHKENIRNYLEHIRNEEVSLRQKIVLKENYDNNFDQALSDLVDKAIRSNNFEEIYVYNGLFYFCQKNECNLNDGGDVYNFGKYIIIFNPIETRWSVSPYYNNKVCHKVFIHPHVFENATICWGNASASYTDLNSKMKYYDILNIANEILNSWNPASPVVVITENWINLDRKVYKEYNYSRLYHYSFYSDCDKQSILQSPTFYKIYENKVKTFNVDSIEQVLSTSIEVESTQENSEILEKAKANINSEDATQAVASVAETIVVTNVQQNVDSSVLVQAPTVQYEYIDEDEDDLEQNNAEIEYAARILDQTNATSPQVLNTVALVNQALANVVSSEITQEILTTLFANHEPERETG